MSLRTVRWSQAAWAVLCESKSAASPKWTDVTHNPDRSVDATIESTTYDVLVQRQRELGLGSISDTIVYLYRTPPSTKPPNTENEQC